MDSTGAQAAGALKRRLYPVEHPNHVRAPDVELAGLEALTVEHVRDYHAAHVGSDGFKLVVVGDIEPTEITAAVESYLGDWPAHGKAARFTAVSSPLAPGRVDVPMADKQNLDVLLGHPVDLRRDDPDFLALYVGNFILGGNFSARLMQTIRDEQGLTYGIGSRLSGIAVEHGGHWRVGVSLSQADLERGIAATQKVVSDFIAGGVTEAELEEKQTTIAGTHVVDLATTSGLAARLLVNAERGFPVSYLDDYPALIKALTVEEVNAVLKRYLDPDALHIAVAGTLPDQSGR
jgi:predicted Zn-dependent peptidase